MKLIKFENNSRLNKKNYLIICIVYCLAHWMLLVVSGMWWDDWCSYGLSSSQGDQANLQLGRPDGILLSRILELLPNGSNRVIVFVLYFLVSIMLYYIIVQGFKICEKKALWTTFLFISLPINDARIMGSTFTYSVGLFLFISGFFTLVRMYRNETRKRFIHSVLSLALFLASFILNSNLVFYVAIIIPFIIWKNGGAKNVFKFSAFFLLPFVFFGVKNLCFPPSGTYAGYNEVTFDKLLYAIKYFSFADIFVLRKVASTITTQCFRNQHGVNVFCIIGICVLIMAYVFILYRKRERKTIWKTEWKDKKTILPNILMLSSGVIILSAALFPYVVVRQSWKIGINMALGRDSVLAGFGIALIISSVISIIDINRLGSLIISIVVFLGIISLNMLYVSYQTDYYRHLGLQSELKRNEQLRDVGTIEFITDQPSELGGFYTLNVNAEIAYGNQKHFIMNPSEKMWLEEKNREQLRRFVNSPIYHMMEYKIGDGSIDARMYFHTDIDFVKTLQLKVMQLFSFDDFNNQIIELSHMDVEMVKER